jgi:uncharacterized membrane protein YoaK (UPF0700 family)
MVIIMVKWIRNEIDLLLHYNMSMVGGFLGAYALLERGGNFGSSQTSNMIYLMVGWLHGSVSEILIHTFSLLIYIITLIIAFLLPKYVKADMRCICIIAEVIGVLFTGFLPAKMNPIVALYPIFAMTGLQWGTFSGAKGYASSTIFSTNNLRQTVYSFTEYCRTKKSADLQKFKFFMLTLIFYHSGVVIGFISVVNWHVTGIWMCIAPLITAFTLLTAATAAQRRTDDTVHTVA